MQDVCHGTHLTQASTRTSNNNHFPSLRELEVGWINSRIHITIGLLGEGSLTNFLTFVFNSLHSFKLQHIQLHPSICQRAESPLTPQNCQSNFSPTVCFTQRDEDMSNTIERRNIWRAALASSAPNLIPTPTTSTNSNRPLTTCNELPPSMIKPRQECTDTCSSQLRSASSDL
jgi:hypothetical protein